MTRAVVRLLLGWGALLLLLGATVAVAFLPLGSAKVALGYAIAAIKAGLILWLFMEVRRDNPVARLAAAAAFVWIAILLTLTAADYLTRTGSAG